MGTSKVRCLVGEVLRDESVTVLAVAEVESRGIRKGEMLNRDEALLAVRDVLKETKYIIVSKFIRSYWSYRVVIPPFALHMGN